MSISIIKEQTRESKLRQGLLDNIIFGRLFADHMLEADYSSDQWQKVFIKPYDKIQLSPANAALHYGQSVFEGMKATKAEDGTPLLFRPRQNWERLNRSARRMQMPEVPEEIFMGGLKELLKLDAEWIPTTPGSSLYIRPFLFATDEYIGIKASDNYKFMIFCCPVGSYYPEPIKVRFERKYVRACPGGVGAAKAAGNYAASLYPAAQAQKNGYRQLIWTDANEHKYIEESGTMNIFFHIDDKVLTPALDGTILEGVTRDSAIQLLRDRGVEVEERKVSIDEIEEAYNNGRLKDVWGTGTAATIAQISAIGNNDSEMKLPPVEERELSSWLLETLEAIKRGQIEDKFGWIERV